MRVQLAPPSDAGAYGFSHGIRVRFGETDAMGIVHHSAYLLYLEEARVAYLRAIDRPYTRLREMGLDMAVLEAWVGYRAPLRFDEIVDVGVVVMESSRATFQIGYRLSVEGQLRATALTIHGCVDGQGRARRIPDWLKAP